ncbi:MAG: pyridoxal-phosphate dependent enzyme [Acidimicrobiales bacterium]
MTLAAEVLAPIELHRSMPGYAPTPLLASEELAGRLGVARVLVKYEAERFGLPSFKMLGASYACYTSLVARSAGLLARSGRATRLGGAEPVWGGDRRGFAGLREVVASLAPLSLVTATDGNHGRAVARVAGLLGLGCLVFVPAGTATARSAAIEGEGATVVEVDGDYDAAVRAAAAFDGSDGHLVISDTSWPGYEEVPQRVIEGYSTMFAEIAETLGAFQVPWPDAVFVPVGVGALAAATISNLKSAPAAPRACKVVSVEPLAADALARSIRAGRPETVPGPHGSIMAGLNCGTPSPVAWPVLLGGIDACVSVPDDAAAEAMRDLASAGIVAGETGAASLAGAAAVLLGPEGLPVRQELGLGPSSSVLLLCTEWATDPGAYERIVGRKPSDVMPAAGTAPVS